MSCNFLTTRVIDMNKNSDTLSEVSESGTGTSGWNSNWDSREELRDFVTKLGLKDVSDLYQDRFRVDRKKLEQMLTGDNEALIPADVFFAKIMEDTDTYITWPNKLKIGAKSKKDPHVRVAGRPEDVQAAKERIMTILDTRCNRVTMKMDVSYTDHSHIIGKGGQSIKRVMEETQCHVHFPDSNRTNPTEKSNQVSISGDIDGVEKARGRVRELIPLIFGFELPITNQNIDATSSYVVKIQEQYKVLVMFKTRPKLHATLVLVKGVEWEVEQVKHATLLLMEFMCENLASQTPVQMSMEISPHHHPTVLGKNHSNLKAIMQYTNCQIMFPDAQDPNIPNLKKSYVNITGNIHNVYKARQLLMGSLPLIIIFDLPEDSTSLKIRPDQLAEIQSSCDLTINIRQKAKQNTKACVLKGVEKHASNIYKARSLILGLSEASLVADIPAFYHLPSLSPPSPFPSSPLVTPTNPNPPQLVSPLLSSLFTPTWPWGGNTNNESPAPPFVGMTQQSQFVYGNTNMMQQQQQQQQQQQTSGMLQQSMGSSGYLSMNQSQFMSNSLAPTEHSRDHNHTLSTISSHNSSLSSPRNSVSPCYRNFPESPDNKELPDFSAGYHGQSVDKRQDRISMASYDLENKRLAGLRAMQTRPCPGEFRLPTNSWSGYGISHTMSSNFADNAKSKKFDFQEEGIWKLPSLSASSHENFPMSPSANSSPVSASLNTSNILDHTSSHILKRVTTSDWPDLPSMLTSLGLDRYMSVFTRHEIDLTTFTTLTDQDLIEIGINAFGARRKILLAISELNKRSSPFSAAPGAERKTLKPTNSNMNYGNSRDHW